MKSILVVLSIFFSLNSFAALSGSSLVSVTYAMDENMRRVANVEIQSPVLESQVFDFLATDRDFVDAENQELGNLIDLIRKNIPSDDLTDKQLLEQSLF